MIEQTKEVAMDNVVKLKKDGAIALVALEEKEFGNTFTKRFIYSLKDTFEEIRRDTSIKVVVVHGYENYFCCGGTKEELIGLYEGFTNKQEGGAQFTDLNFHDLLFRCEVPVVSAMQGHALGGGLAFGCFADVIVMGEQCLYSANFMKYGFSPGMGATYIVPRKLGNLLGTEMLFTARNYYGRELKERGAPVKVVNRQGVIDAALEIAAELADKPRLSLVELKKHLTAGMVADIEHHIRRELEMHRITFAQPEVRKRIESLFGN